MKTTTCRFGEEFDRLTHYLFRYPAKFHPPVASFLIRSFSDRGHTILDPFCGSGTLLVEGAVAGRRTVGVDVDPVATFVARVKSSPLTSNRSSNELRKFLKIIPNLSLVRRNTHWIPDIPNIGHWFEPHVLDQIAALQWHIDNKLTGSQTRQIAKCAFLNCIRGWSNADPVPVSGLEVTKHIREKRKNGFHPDVKRQYIVALTKTLASIETYSARLEAKSLIPTVIQSDASGFLRRTRQTYDSLITSPPYLTAVDYYRRHTLEMFWLDPSLDKDKRLQLKKLYIGQYQVSSSMIERAEATELTARTERLAVRIEDRNEYRARAFRHYFSSMKDIFFAAATRVKRGGRIVIVIGNGRMDGDVIRTGSILAEEIAPVAVLKEIIKYPLRNRYMTYERRNQANIDQEQILVFRNR